MGCGASFGAIRGDGAKQSSSTSGGATSSKHLQGITAVAPQQEVPSCNHCKTTGGSIAIIAPDKQSIAVIAPDPSFFQKPNLRQHACEVLKHQVEALKILTDPEHARLPDGSTLMETFHRIFRELQESEKENSGVTPYLLEKAIQDYAETLPEALGTRIRFVVSEVFEQEDTTSSASGVITWSAFLDRIKNRDEDEVQNDEAMAELFELLDDNNNGIISAQELMEVLVIMAEARSSTGSQGEDALPTEIAQDIIRDLDVDGRGEIGLSDFTEAIRASRERLVKLPRSESKASAKSAQFSKNVLVGEVPRNVSNYNMNLQETRRMSNQVSGTGGLLMPSRSGTGGLAPSAGSSDTCAPFSSHLTLNFDVNNTVILLDTVTDSDLGHTLSAVLANVAWGTVEKDEDGRDASWKLACDHPSGLAPQDGLQTYTEFVNSANPLPGVGPDVDREALQAARRKRRQIVWNFCKPGCPGEALQSYLEQMISELMLPASIVGTEAAVAAGLTGQTVQLLPSFLRMVLDLKRSNRSFTLIFRTFGVDLDKVEKELNALCEGRHPLFPDDQIVLDGSDGAADYRMCLKQGCTTGCGTFYRDPHKDDFLALILGTTQQPDTIQEGMEYFNQFTDVEVVTGVDPIFKLYEKFGTECRTVALRDFFPSWQGVGSKAHGGKPFLLGCLNDPTKHCIFFDDHISAANPKIVDPIDARHWPQRFTSAQLYGVHLVKAEPLKSISRPDYFMECIRECEVNRRLRMKRWELAQGLLGDLLRVQQVIQRVSENKAERRKVEFQPYVQCDTVKHGSTAPTFEESNVRSGNQ